MRINKYLAWKGFATRRDADKLIARKAVTVNGRFAVLGDKVNADDRVEVSSSGRAENYVYYAYNKPVGVTTGETRKGGDKDVLQSAALKGVFPVGSLERKDGGLMILTNDRRLIDRLENPTHSHLRRYLVETRDELRTNFKEKVEVGLSIDGGPAIRARVDLKAPNACVITLYGHAYPIRAMLSLFRAEADKLTRTDILNVNLGKLAPNSHRLITGEEREIFLKSLGL